MITKIIDENSISCVPEDSDDLIILRRVIKKGDKIVGETVRVVKQEKDFARPDHYGFSQLLTKIYRGKFW